MTGPDPNDLALEYCPKCGHEFHSGELAHARNSIKKLAELRDKQGEQIRMLAAGGTLVEAD